MKQLPTSSVIKTERYVLAAKLLMIRGSQQIMKMCRRGINHLRLFSRELDKLNQNHFTRNLVHRLESLGYSVALAPQQIAA